MSMSVGNSSIQEKYKNLSSAGEAAGMAGAKAGAAAKAIAAAGLAVGAAAVVHGKNSEKEPQLCDQSKVDKNLSKDSIKPLNIFGDSNDKSKIGVNTNKVIIEINKKEPTCILAELHEQERKEKGGELIQTVGKENTSDKSKIGAKTEHSIELERKKEPTCILAELHEIEMKKKFKDIMEIKK